MDQLPPVARCCDIYIILKRTKYINETSSTANVRVYFSTYVSEHSLQNPQINKLNRKVALNES